MTETEEVRAGDVGRTRVQCECGEWLTVLPQEPDGYRLRHGDHPEAVSPHLRGEERSFDWRSKVHSYYGTTIEETMCDD